MADSKAVCEAYAVNHLRGFNDVRDRAGVRVRNHGIINSRTHRAGATGNSTSRRLALDARDS